MNHSDPTQSQLGKTSAYIDQYDASLLFPINRTPKRVEIGVNGVPPFFGADLWTAYELSWLNAKGKPQVALAHFTLPADSPCIIESKSFKLYLNSLNNTRLQGLDHGVQAVHDLMAHDLSDAVGARVAVKIELLPQERQPKITAFSGAALDRLDIACSLYTPAPELLRCLDEAAVEETVYSDLLKSNCLVTGQPDWGSVEINYLGAPIDHAGLLQYIVSFRNHNEFHEQCVERIFMDIWQRCAPTRLTVYARYTRRGGLDINPYRTSQPGVLPSNVRHSRQ
jgi:7-cyano-7-deazaguanine reductase